MKQQKTKSNKKKTNGKLKKWVKKHKALTIIICVILVIAIVVSSVAISKSKSSEDSVYSFIRTTTLSKGSLDDSVSATGTVKSANTSSVTTALQYTVEKVNVAVGDSVKEGDVICTLDSSDLEKQIEKEEANLTKSKTSAQNSYNNAKTSYETAQTAYNSANTTYLAAKTPYLTAYNSVKSFQTKYDSAMKSYQAAGAKLATAMSNYAANKTKANAQKFVNAYYAVYGDVTQSKTFDISDGSSGSSSSDSMGNSNTQSSSNSVTLSSSLALTYSSAKTTYSIKPSTSSTVTLRALQNAATNLKNAKTSSNFTTLESAYTTAQSAYKSAKNEYTQAKSNLSQAQTELNNVSSDSLDELENQLELCSLKAESDGIVTALNATVGSSCKDTVATIQDMDSLIVSITIDEADINKISTGLTCHITSDASDETLDGKLTQIDPVSSSDSTFGAKVTVETKTSTLKIGMNASVSIIISSSEDVYQVPIDAVGNDDNGDFIYRQTGGSGTDMTFEKVYVTTGSKNDYYIEVSSDDLKDGDVIRSSSDLTQGIEETSTKTQSSSGFSLASLFGGGNDSNMQNMKGNGNFNGGSRPDMSSNDNSSSSGTPPQMPNGGE